MPAALQFEHGDCRSHRTLRDRQTTQERVLTADAAPGGVGMGISGMAGCVYGRSRGGLNFGRFSGLSGRALTRWVCIQEGG